MLETFIGYNSGYYENDKKDTKKILHTYYGINPPNADRAYYACSSKAGT
jgi:hypothetical protein